MFFWFIDFSLHFFLQYFTTQNNMDILNEMKVVFGVMWRVLHVEYKRQTKSRTGANPMIVGAEKNE